MEKGMFLICIPMVLAFFAFQSVEGCSCLRDSLTNLYKNSDFVFIGKLLNKTADKTFNGEPDFNADTNYVVQILKVYVGDNLVNGTEQVNIRTPGIASLCGIYLEVHHNYIFNGLKTTSTEGDPTLTITSCNMMLRSPITPEMMSFVEGALLAMQ